MRGLLIYCERSGSWAVALRREPGLASLAQRETRSISECREVLEQCPASLVVQEITATGLERTLEWLVELSRRFPEARFVVAAARGLESHEWVIREFGALAFVASPRELAPVAALVRRYFAALPPVESNWEEQIWSQLPWQAVAE